MRRDDTVMPQARRYQKFSQEKVRIRNWMVVCLEAIHPNRRIWAGRVGDPHRSFSDAKDNSKRERNF
jgi:hypothetical protein